MASRLQALVPQSVVVTRVQIYRVREEWPGVLRALLLRQFTGQIVLHCNQGTVGAVHVQENEK